MKTTKRRYLGLGAWMLLIVLFCAAGARAATIAADQFIIDAAPDGYTAGNLYNKGPNTTGMSSATKWQNATSRWQVDATGLDFAASGGEAGGSAWWIGVDETRSVYRELDS
ncbi:MAG: hypothetical protein HN383_17865, partial [Verrucomicrobia bacterium]|nr:hypothetical protein [Verrucomicrobiota bacterium]